MVKQQNFFLLLFLILVLSLGCQSESAVPEPTTIAAATNTTTAPTATPTMEPTNTAVPPTSTPQPTATATAVPIDWSLIQNNATILYYHDKDLWRTDIDGNQQPLTEGDLLAAWDLESDEDKWWSGGPMPRPFISPDGRYIALTETGSNLIIIDLADPTTPRTLSSGSIHMAWSPDSRYLAYGRSSLYLYDTMTQRSDLLTSGIDDRANNITWSSDGQYIGYACCFEEPEGDAYEGIGYGLIKQYSLETGSISTVGETTRSIGGGVASNCWQEATAEFVSQVDAKQVDYCTNDGTSIFYTAQAPDLERNAKMLFSDPNDPLHFHQLTVEIIGSSEILWETVLDEPANRLAWTLDGRYILLNNHYPGLSPIYRLLADGTAPPEPLVEDAYLIGVIPQWQSPE